MASLEFLSDGLMFFDKSFLYLDILRMTISAFLATIFLQSGIDKILNWNSELDWMSKQFENTPLASSLHVGLFVVTILEILGGSLSALGILWILFRDGHSVGLLGTMFCSFSLCILMFGQRISKNYDGAASLVPYFTISILGFYFYTL
tara:strand:- start:1634 stop:2077 length:444 start_codon:yes stop_codon:yes gene_type:complete